METEAQRKARLKKTAAKFAELSAADSATRVAGITLKGAAQGLGAFPDLFSAVGNLGLSLSGKEPIIPYASEKIKEGFNYLTDSQFEPRTPAEKMGERAIEFVSGGGATNLGVKGLQKAGVNLGSKLSRFLTTKGAKEYAAAAGAGAGLEAGREYAPDSVPLQVIGSVLGGSYASGVPSLAKGVAQGLNPKNLKNLPKTISELPRNIAADLFSINPEKVKAFQDAGLTPTLSNISDSPVVGMSENILKNTPFASSPITKAIEATQGEISKYGEGLTREQGGELAQKALKDWRIKGSKIAGNLQKKVDRHVSSFTPIKLTDTLKLMKEEKPKAYTDVAKGIFEKSSTGKKFSEINEALNQVKQAAEENFNKGFDLDGNAIGNEQINEKMKNITDAIEALKSGEILPYSDAVILRKSVDSILDGRFDSAYGETFDINLLKDLRGSLQKDISNALQAISPQAAKDNARFNKFYNQYATKRDKLIAPLLEKKTPTETFIRIVNNANVDAKALKTLKSTLKPDKKEVFTKSLIKELGSNAQNEFNASQLATSFKKLDPEAQKIALAGLSPEYQKKFKATIEAIDAVKDTMSTGNQSRTAYAGSLLATGAALATTPATTILGLAGGKVVSEKLFTNTKFLDWASKASNLKNPKKLKESLKSLDVLKKQSPRLAADISKYQSDVESQLEGRLEESNITKKPPSFETFLSSGTQNNTEVKTNAQTNTPKAKVNFQSFMSGGSNNNQGFVRGKVDQRVPQNVDQMTNESTSAIDNTLIDKIAQVESGGNPNAKAKTSTASGLLQFTDGTWRNGVQKYGNELGITLKDKANPKAQKALAARMLEDNAQNLQTFLNREPTEGELYLTHFLGLEGAKKLLKSDPSQLAARLFPAAAKANKAIFFKGGKAITNQQLLAMMENKIAKA